MIEDEKSHHLPRLSMFKHTLQPRFTDCDGLGHISNTTLPVWFEEARAPIFKIFNPSLLLTRWNLIIKKFEIDLHHQIWHHQPVQIDTEFEHIGTSSMIVIQRAYQDGKLVADGRTVLIHFDYEAQTTVAIPQAIRAQLTPHLNPSAKTS